MKISKKIIVKFFLIKIFLELLSIYEFLCVIIITAYTHYVNKVHCNIINFKLKVIYILFDLDGSGNI